jgi:SWIM zinc finger
MKVATQQVNTPVRHGRGWLVASSRGGGAYYVQVDAQDMRCSCPAWVYAGSKRHTPCKHIRREVGMTQEVTRG